jgi:hypothetical protein
VAGLNQAEDYASLYPLGTIRPLEHLKEEARPWRFHVAIRCCKRGIVKRF